MGNEVLYEGPTKDLTLYEVVENIFDMAMLANEKVSDFCSHYLTFEEIGIDLFGGKELSEGELSKLFKKINHEIKRRNNLFNEVLPLSEASEIWGVHPSTVRNASKKFHKEEYKVVGRVTLVTKFGMQRVFGHE